MKYYKYVGKDASDLLYYRTDGNGNWWNRFVYEDKWIPCDEEGCEGELTNLNLEQITKANIFTALL